MTNAVTQQIPLALIAFTFGADVMSGFPVVASSNAATLEWKTTAELPTQCSPVVVAPAAERAVPSTGFALLALARLALPDSRPMSDRERKHADDFFWSQFA